MAACFHPNFGTSIKFFLPHSSPCYLSMQWWQWWITNCRPQWSWWLNIEQKKGAGHLTRTWQTLEKVRSETFPLYFLFCALFCAFILFSATFHCNLLQKVALNMSDSALPWETTTKHLQYSVHDNFRGKCAQIVLKMMFLRVLRCLPPTVSCVVLHYFPSRIHFVRANKSFFTW